MMATTSRDEISSETKTLVKVVSMPAMEGSQIITQWKTRTWQHLHITLTDLWKPPHITTQMHTRNLSIWRSPTGRADPLLSLGPSHDMIRSFSEFSSAGGDEFDGEKKEGGGRGGIAGSEALQGNGRPVLLGARKRSPTP
ncbi:unnamed protein product [Linum trigynum]